VEIFASVKAVTYFRNITAGQAQSTNRTTFH